MKYIVWILAGTVGMGVATALEPAAYSPEPRKAVAVPAATTAPVVDGVLDDAGWQGATRFDDFSCYKSDSVPGAATQVAVLRHGADLYLGIRCEEPGTVAAGVRDDGFAIWQGDVVEIFFGALDPQPWLTQLAVGAGGGRFSDTGDYSSWEARTTSDEHGWSAEVRIPLRMLTIADLGIGFNLCRQRRQAGELTTWGPVRYSFHEPENFGELLLCPYPEAALNRFGALPEGALDRKGYESFAAEHTPAASAVTHGPYLSNPSATGMTVSWETAGRTAAVLEYREAGGKTWHDAPAALQNGVIRSDLKRHVADLSGLTPGTTYEYRLAHFLTTSPERVYAPGGTFTALSPERDRYRFAVVSDIHGDSPTLERLWRNSDAREADFCVDLGDMLSSLNGPGAFFHGFLDMQTKLFAKERPLVFVRGNHELRGFYAGGYFDYMHHPSGRTYYAFRQGPVLFLVLDGMADHTEADAAAFLKQERAWLEEIAASEEFRQARFRVALMHFPLWDDERFETQVARQLIGGILDGAEPERRIHLWIGGHLHEYFRLDPQAAALKSLDGKFKSAALPRLPFTVVGNDGPGDGGVESSILTVDVTPDALTVKAFDATGRELDRFRIRPDGGVETNR